ncbi:OLC1v1014465C1 [Oldenlandia corymbosa var. corymbosa]|uniref:OLC1v1014465C1 n=1 Tax=Oldenlandia corymbosa var. corymbosa TaxID=529605 RepID=A0AAV1E470_OLDCO|nr:OLC1v1014465C1 [Oldenlandia corymbosa var. corymbosa]
MFRREQLPSPVDLELPQSELEEFFVGLDKVIDLSQPDKWLRGNSGFPKPSIKAGVDDEPPSKATNMLAGDKGTSINLFSPLSFRFTTNIASVYHTSDQWIEGDSLDFPFWNLQGTRADDPEYLQLIEKFEAEFCRPGQVPIDLDIVNPDILRPIICKEDPYQYPLASLYPKKVKGRIILAFLVKEGVIVAADHQMPLFRLIVTFSLLFLDDIDKGRALLLDVRNKCYGGIPVEDTAKLVSEALLTSHGNEEGLSLTTIIAGFRSDLTAERGIEMGKCAICRAGYRACETGGFASGYYIGAGGWRKVFDNINIEDTIEIHFPDQFDGRRVPVPH